MAEQASRFSLLPWLGGLVILLLLVGGGSLALRGEASARQIGLSAILTELTVLSQSAPRQAIAALQGSKEAFAALRDSRSRFEAARAELATSRTGWFASSWGMTELDGQGAGWIGFAKNIDQLTAAERDIMETHQSVGRVSQLMPQLLTETSKFLAVEGRAGGVELMDYLGGFQRAAQGLDKDLLLLANGQGDVESVLAAIAAKNAEMGEILGSLAGGEGVPGGAVIRAPAAQEKLRLLGALHQQVGDRVEQILAAGDVLISAHLSSRSLAAAGDAIYSELRGAEGGLAEARSGWLFNSYLPATLLGLALATFLLIAWLHLRSGDTRQAAARHAEQNEKNQQAILRLLDELGSLGEGDLTVQATVTEDITGAIADSINYAIEKLRELVTTINVSSIMVDAAAKQTEATALHLTKASEQQSSQVAAATDSVSQMAASIEEVSGNAERSADVARHSVDVAHKGGDAVRRTIDGMNTIRETIQETSKRIKRLGESSQEIGNIIELINDIAEQTNILALNASIQASMAGEAGRGFAVVADEVQRLAERSANATKQIEVLVRTIQSDTNEAVVSMERSTTDVVGGALLAENAGAALEEIEQVSNQIATLVQNISSSARQQATGAQDISRNMSVLQEISSQTAESTSATSSSISKLSELATQLRTSVAGFRLPDFETGTAVMLGDKQVPQAEGAKSAESDDDQQAAAH